MQPHDGGETDESTSVGDSNDVGDNGGIDNHDVEIVKSIEADGDTGNTDKPYRSWYRRHGWIVLWIVSLAVGIGAGIAIHYSRGQPYRNYTRFSIYERVQSCENGVLTIETNKTLWPIVMQQTCNQDIVQCCETESTFECVCQSNSSFYASFGYGTGYSGNLNVPIEYPPTVNMTDDNHRKLLMSASFLRIAGDSKNGTTLSFEMANSVDEWVALGFYDNFACSVCENDRQSIRLPAIEATREEFRPNSIPGGYSFNVITNRKAGRTPSGRINIYGSDEHTSNVAVTLFYDWQCINDIEPPLKTGPWVMTDDGFFSSMIQYRPQLGQPNVPLTIHARSCRDELDIHTDKRMVDQCIAEHDARSC